MSVVFTGVKPSGLPQHTDPIADDGVFVYEHTDGVVKHVSVTELKVKILENLGWEYQDFPNQEITNTYTFTNNVSNSPDDFMVFANGQLRYATVTVDSSTQITVVDADSFIADVRILYKKPNA